MVYYFFNIYVLGTIGVLFCILLILLKKIGKKSNVYLLFFAIMYIYLCAVIDVTQFPIYATDGMRVAMGGQNVWREMNLIPFQSIIQSPSIDAILNIIMTIPLGFGLPFLVKTGWKRVVLSGVGIGIAIEIVQLISALIIGFTFRNVNIDDVIMNLFGTIAGYILFLFFKHFFLWGYHRLAINNNSFLDYVADTCRNSPSR
jgi:glycopeptide antibiotics resistance protein